MNVVGLKCTSCGNRLLAGDVYNVCSCGKPLDVVYDLDRIGSGWDRDRLVRREPNLWRYRDVLPLPENAARVSLGEGWTPLIRAIHLEQRLGVHRIYLKDESVNPTGSFKARGMAVAVSMARTLGLKHLAIPSAGNAGGALCAYAARGGLYAHVFMPSDTPRANIVECQAYGADVNLVDGLISDCGIRVAEYASKRGWFDMSTLKEPYRVEGKKTMGYELAEQLGWELPDVVLYPTGGGTGLIGMAKAFHEMEYMGWVGPNRPRMVVVQAAGCAPIVHGFLQGLDHGSVVEQPSTIASGLRVPTALGDFLILNILKSTHGTAVAVPDDAILDGVFRLSREEGIFPSPEGGACLPALESLVRSKWIKKDETVVLFLTGSGLKYIDCLNNPDLKASPGSN